MKEGSESTAPRGAGSERDRAERHGEREGPRQEARGARGTAPRGAESIRTAPRGAESRERIDVAARGMDGAAFSPPGVDCCVAETRIPQEEWARGMDEAQEAGREAQDLGERRKIWARGARSRARGTRGRARGLRFGPEA